MKTTSLLKLVWLFVLALAFTACVDDNDYTVPSIEVQDPNLTATNTIQSVLDMYKNSVVDFNAIGTGLVIEGYVVSSDESGNIYKTIAIQDKPTNPTAAVQLAVDATDLYTFYEVGRKVYVKLNGLALHSSNGVLEIGQLDGTSVERIASTDYKKHILRSTETATITPLVIDRIEDITDANISMLVQLNDMRAQIKGITYANTKSTYAVNRVLSSCSSAGTISMRNSGFATFKAQQIPEKRGSIVAVLGKYRNDYQLFIRDTEDINFKQDYDCSSNATLKTIADIKALYKGSETTITDDIKIKAVITSDLSKDNISDRNAFIQDATAGIALRFSEAYDLNLGDEVEIYVRNLKVSEFRGLLQLNVAPSNILNTTQGTLPAPEVITIEQALSGNYESKLVKIEGVQFKDITKNYAGSNVFTSDCANELITFVRNGASFANTQVSDKKGAVTGIMSEFDTPQLYIRDTSDINFADTYACSSTGGGTGGSTSNNFDFEAITPLSTSYATTGSLTATDGTQLDYVARTNVGSYGINGQGLMMKDAGYIKVTFPNGVKQVSFNYRGAFTNSSDRVVIVNEGDENSTTELEKVTFPFDTAPKTLTLDLNKTGAYTITIKGGTSRQIVIDDIKWTTN